MTSLKEKTKSKIKDDKKIKIKDIAKSNYKDMNVILSYDDKVYFSKIENKYEKDDIIDYDKNSLIYISDNKRMFHFLHINGWVLPQHWMLRVGLKFTDYEEFDKLQNTILSQFKKVRDIYFGDKFFESPEIALKKVNTEKYIGKKVQFCDDFLFMVTNNKDKRKNRRERLVGVVVGIDDNNAYFYNEINSNYPEHYKVNLRLFKIRVYEGKYIVDYEKLSEKEKNEMEKYKNSEIKSEDFEKTNDESISL